MSHPPASYLTPETVEQALVLARELRAASGEIGQLTGGTPVVAVGGAAASGLGAGRAGDAAIAAREWVGPHRDTFDRMIDDEAASAEAARSALDDEADAWAGFWAEATNARRQRLYEEAMADHRLASDRYEREFTDYAAALATDPAAASYLGAPRRPERPPVPEWVVAPTAASGYRPTG